MFAISVTFDLNENFIPCSEPFSTSGCIRRIKSNLEANKLHESYKGKNKHICLKTLSFLVLQRQEDQYLEKRIIVLLTKNFYKCSLTLKLRINRPELTRRRFLFLCVKFSVLVACRQTKHLNHNIQIYIFLL